MNLELGTLIFEGAKSLGNLFLKEIKEKMQNNNISQNAKIKINKNRNEIIASYGDIYEARNGEFKLYRKGNCIPEYIGATDLNNGFYIKENNSFKLDKNLTKKINEELEKNKNYILKEEKEFIKSKKVKGEEYIVDEIGDDEKYIFLTRKKTNEEFQEFISDEFYNKLLNENKENLVLIFNGKDYEIK